VNSSRTSQEQQQYASPDFPGGSDGKASVYNVGDPGSIPRSGRSPGEGNGNPLQYYCWKIPWMEEPSRLQSMGTQRVGHNWATSLHWRFSKALSSSLVYRLPDLSKRDKEKRCHYLLWFTPPENITPSSKPALFISCLFESLNPCSNENTVIPSYFNSLLKWPWQPKEDLTVVSFLGVLVKEDKNADLSTKQHWMVTNECTPSQGMRLYPGRDRQPYSIAHKWVMHCR